MNCDISASRAQKLFLTFFLLVNWSSVSSWNRIQTHNLNKYLSFCFLSRPLVFSRRLPFLIEWLLQLKDATYRILSLYSSTGDRGLSVNMLSTEHN